MRNPILIFSACCLFQSTLFGQQTLDSSRHRVGFKPFLAPTVLLVGGLATQGRFSRQVQNQILKRFGIVETKADDFLQFAPTVVMLGLGTAGVRGRHELKDQLVLTILSHGAAQAITRTLKYTVAYPRPDGDGFESFPSGHTTTAFTGAALLAREYNGRSVWFGIGGYGVATTVGALRVLQNRHWLADVLFGAGVGIGATQGVYAIYPWLRRKVFRSRKSVFLPIYNGYSAGVYWVVVL
ncbi:MAG: phosphatase PAP2 family protein [Cytophagaceae bacterium]|nr:phosphatase PAP2 family protein [Cytophagaceae bacterium]